METFFSILIIVLSLASLMYCAYRGGSVIIVAPIIAMVTVIVGLLFGGTLDPLYSLTQVYMPALVTFIQAYFPLFLVGSVFGKIMGDSGAAKVVARTIAKLIGEEKAILVVVLATAILTYFGVSLFVVVFAVYPIAVELFRKADIPKRLIAPAIALGGFTFTMTAMPGSPQSINAIPTTYLGTDIYAAPILGILASVVMFSLGMIYLTKQSKKANDAGEGYGNHDDGIVISSKDDELPSIFASILPLLVVCIGNFFFVWFFKQQSVINYYAKQYKLEVASPVNTTWGIVITISLASVIALILYRKNIKYFNKTITDGSVGSLLPIFNTASENGYGGVIKLMPGFAALQTVLLSISVFPLLKIALATTALAAVVGSSSAGTALALSTFNDAFLQMMTTYNIPAEVVHRVVLVSAGCLDSLPHCGAVITLLTVTHLTHKESFKDIAVNTIVIPFIALTVIVSFYYTTGLY